MPSIEEQLKAPFQDALRRPERQVTQPAVEQGPTAGRRPDRSLFLLSLDRIRPDPDQVRRMNKSETDQEVRELAESIRAIGIENPLTVRYLPAEDIYELVAGERRFTAAKLAALSEVPVKVVDVDEKGVRRLQLHENIHRADLAPLELAAALQDHTEEGDSPQDLARMLCKSVPYVQKALTIARKLTNEARAYVQAHPTSFKSIDQLYDTATLLPEKQLPILRRIAEEGLTRDEVRSLTATGKEHAKADRGSRRGRQPDTRPFRQTLRVDNGALVTVSFRKARATPREVKAALEQALELLDAPSESAH